MFDDNAPSLKGAPSLGEHTDDVLKEELRLDMEEIIGLKVKGIIM
jgi:crotonobetainyl-CoA:carnitine CoA-transferase CaiB-like acyl-CoA transferase